MKKTLFLCFALLGSFTARADNDPTLATLEVSLAPGQTLPLASKIAVSVKSDDAKNIATALNDWHGIEVLNATATQLTVALTETSHYTGVVTPQYTSPSFVIDYTEPDVVSVTNKFLATHSLPFSLDDLTQHISGHITNASYIHSFNFASVVARQRSGDCTEYAVLATALARSVSLPARVVIGTVILESETEVRAYGHAWAEVWQHEKWHVVDAALYGNHAKRLFYLPIGTLENEGMGFALSLAYATKSLPDSVEALRSITPSVE